MAKNHFDELAAQIAKHFSTEGANITFNGQAAWQEAVESSGLTMDTVAKVRELDVTYHAGFVSAMGAHCNQASKENPDISNVFLESPMGAHDKDVTKGHARWQRSVEMPKIGSSSGETTTRYGAMDTGMTYPESDRLMLSKARKAVSSTAAALFQDAAVAAAMS